MKKIVLATRNQGKIKEFRELLKGLEVEIAGLDQFPQIEEIAETGSTFQENALLKAETASRLTGLPVVADDSGLEVDALNGAPGVNSARFAGVHGDDAANNRKLLQLLKDIPLAQRTGRFVCAMAISFPGSEPVVVEGKCEGRIATEPRGDGGFGYDPLFIPHGYQITMGEMSQEEKNKISHRAQAVAQAVAIIKERLTI